MAEQNTSPEETAENSGGWWGSWISSAKSKSAEVYSMVKKDLDEISNAVKSEASHVYTATSSVLEKTLKLDEPESTANVMKKSFSTFLDQVNTVLNPQPDDEDTEVILSTGDTTMLSTYKRELEALQRLDATYLVATDRAQFEAWRSSLEESELKVTPGFVARALSDEPVLAAQHAKLVPGAVDEQLFWERYLFRTALLQDRIAAAVRSKGLAPALTEDTDPVLAHLPLQIVADQPKPANSIGSAEATPATSEKSSPLKSLSSVSKPASLSVEPSLADDLDEGVAWGDEDFASDVELTEEQQILLLQEYEKEIASKKSKAVPSNEQANNKQSQDDSKQKAEPNKKQNSASKQSVTSKQNKQNVTIKKQSVTTNKQNLKEKDDSKSKPKMNSVNSKASKQRNEKKDAEKNKTPSSETKSVGGNNLIEDHFKDDTKLKDDASSHSDESWEKEFELEEAA